MTVDERINLRKAQQGLNEIVMKKLEEDEVCYANDPDIIECLHDALGLCTPLPETSGWTKEGYSRNVQTK